jgi:hypothetical protein
MTMLKTLLPSASGLRLSAVARTTSPTGRPFSNGLLMAPLALAVCGALAGCSAMTSIDHPTPSSQTSGMVHGGQQPVTGATIQLIAPGITGYGSAGTVLATTTTDGSGSFTLPTYVCPTGNVLVYITATGGNPGAGPNSLLAEAAVLGPCSGLTSIPFVSISEVTTIAAAYTLAPFATLSAGTTTIGTSATNLIGLQNAAAAAGNLASISTGMAPAAKSISGITLPTSEMNTLANILAACVNTNVSGVPSTTCATLLAAATPPGTSPVPPTDTFQAAIDIALNPGNKVSNLFALSTPSAPYQPALTTAPGDFVLGIQYTGGVIGISAGSQGLDIDAQGNAWVAIQGSPGGRGVTAVPGGLVQISPSGVVTPSSTVYLSGMVQPQVVAINSSGVVAITDDATSGYNVLEYSPNSGVPVGFTSLSTSLLSAPTGIAFDNRDSSLWVVESAGNVLTHVSASGAQLTASSPLATGANPYGIAISGAGNVVTTDSDILSTSGSNSGITGYSPNGDGTYSGGNVSTGSGTFPSGVAIDNAGNIWTAQNNGIGKYSSAGAMISPAGGYNSNTDNSALSLEIDGLGRAFVLTESIAHSSQPGGITVFANNGTQISTVNSGYGYQANGTIPEEGYLPNGLAIDSSGNCWITGSAPSVVTELIGLAAPVATPLSAQNAPTNRLGTRP